MIELTLPWPPSVNHYWVRGRTRGGRPNMRIGDKGKAYRLSVVASVCEQIGIRPPRLAGRLAVTILAHPPDRRKRDLDNLTKAPLDALEAAGVYEDDGQIDQLTITRAPVVPNGRLVVTIEEIFAE